MGQQTQRQPMGLHVRRSAGSILFLGKEKTPPHRGGAEAAGRGAHTRTPEPKNPKNPIYLQRASALAS